MCGVSKVVVSVLVVVMLGMGVTNSLDITTTKQLPQCTSVVQEVIPTSELF